MLQCLSGYPLWKGQILNAENLGELYDALKDNGLTDYSHLLTGLYSRDLEF